MKVVKVQTLCIIHKDDKVLLGMKKRGFGAGRWNGFGGKLNPDETVEEAAIREFKEEAGVKVKKMEKQGIVLFDTVGEDDVLEVHFFKVFHFEGEPLESEEMKPAWFHVKEIPFELMWPSDKLWMQMFLDGKKFRGKVYFADQNTIRDFDIKFF